jgi:basic membrane protein A
MKKGLFCVGLIAVLAVSSVFSGGNKEKGRTTATDGQVTVRLLADASGIDDKSFNAAAWQGILEFYGDTWENTRQRGILYDVVSGQTRDQYVSLAQQVTDEKYSLIVSAGMSFADATGEVAAKNPNQKYMLIDEGGFNLPNVLEAIFAEQEGSYLVGVAAALKAKADNIPNPQFGFIGGVPGGTITRFEVGFIQGILSVIPDARIRDYYVGSWNDPGSAKTQAKNWYDSGVYMIFSAAGGSGNGTIVQAKEYRVQGKNVWAIGVDSDQYEDGLYNATESAVFTSMLKNVGNATRYGLEAIKNGTYKGGPLRFGLQNDGVGYAATNTRAMTKDIIDQIEKLRQQVLSGQIKLVSTYAEAKKLPRFPQDLKAMDD